MWRARNVINKVGLLREVRNPSPEKIRQYHTLQAGQTR